MPIIKSAIKRVKQSAKRRERNIGIKKDIKNATKKFFSKPTSKSLSTAQSEIDTAVKKGLIKKNTAARRKSQLSKIAKNAGVKLATAAKTPAVKAEAPKVAKPAVKKAAAKPVAKSATTKKAATKKPVAKK